MSVNIEIKGLKELKKKFSDLNPLLIDGMVDGINKASGVVLASAKSLTPVDTGKLRQANCAIPAYVRGDSIVGGVMNSCDHAMYVEFGTGQRGNGSYPYKTNLSLSYKSEWMGQVAQPFLGRALHTNGYRIDKVVLASVRRKIKEVSK